MCSGFTMTILDKSDDSPESLTLSTSALGYWAWRRIARMDKAQSWRPPPEELNYRTQRIVN